MAKKIVTTRVAGMTLTQEIDVPDEEVKAKAPTPAPAPKVAEKKAKPSPKASS